MTVSLVGSVMKTTSGASSNPVNVALPAGLAVGHMIVLTAAGSWAPSNPAGWTQKDQQNGSNWNGGVYVKVATATEVSAGSVNVTFASGGHQVVVFASAYDGHDGTVNLKWSERTSGTSPTTVTATGSSFGAGSMGVYVTHTRDGSAANTVNRGVLQTSQNTAPTCSFYVESFSSATASVAPAFTNSTADTGHYDVVLEIVSTPFAVPSTGFWGYHS